MWRENSVLRDHCLASLLPNSDPWDRVFYPHQTVMIDSYILTWDQSGVQTYCSEWVGLAGHIYFHLISSQSLNLGGRRGTTDDVATIPFHPSLSSAALRESPNPIPVHSLMLSSHLFFCLPLLLAPFTVPCRIVFAMPEDLEMWPYHLSFRFFTMVKRSSCTPIAFWILLRTSSFVTRRFATESRMQLECMHITQLVMRQF